MYYDPTDYENLFGSLQLDTEDSETTADEDVRSQLYEAMLIGRLFTAWPCQNNSIQDRYERMLLGLKEYG